MKPPDISKRNAPTVTGLGRGDQCAACNEFLDDGVQVEIEYTTDGRIFAVYCSGDYCSSGQIILDTIKQATSKKHIQELTELGQRLGM